MSEIPEDNSPYFDTKQALGAIKALKSDSMLTTDLIPLLEEVQKYQENEDQEEENKKKLKAKLEEIQKSLYGAIELKTESQSIDGNNQTELSVLQKTLDLVTTALKSFQNN